MKQQLLMRRLMFTFLKEKYPNAYKYRSKFGDVTYADKEMEFHVSRNEIVKQIQLLFSCDKGVAESTFLNWKESLPVYVRVENSTNESVLVPLQTEYIPTFLNL